VRHASIKRRLLLVIVVIGVVVAHVLMLLVMYLSPERLRIRIEQEVQSRIEIPVSIGDVRIVGLNTLSVNDVVFGSRKTHENSNNGFIRVDSLRVDVDLFALVSGAQPLSAIAINGVDIRLTENFIESLRRSEEEGDRHKLPRKMSIAGMDIVCAGEVLFDDSPEVSLKSIDIRMEHLSSGSGVYDVMISGNSEVLGHVTAQARVNLEKEDFQATLRSKGTRLGHQLLEIFPSRYTEAASKRFVASGTGDMELDIEGSLAERRMQVNSASARFTGVDFTYMGFPYEVEGVVGNLLWHDNVLTLENMLGHDGKSIVELNGQVDSATDPSKPNMSIIGSDIVVGRKVRNALPEKSHPVWDSFNPTGSVDFKCYVTPAKEGHRLPQTRVIVNCTDVSATYDKLPLQLDGLSGQIVVGTDIFTIKGLKGTCLGEPIALYGDVGWGDESEKRKLRIEFENLSVSEELKVALPETVVKCIDAFELKGNLSLIVAVDFGVTKEEGSEESAEFNGTASLSDISMVKWWPVTGLSGEARFSGTSAESGTTKVVAELIQAKAKIKGFDLSGVSAKIAADSESVSLTAIHGDLYGGHLSGEMAFGEPAGTDIEGFLEFRRIDLEELIEASDGIAKSMTGQIHGRAEFPAISPDEKPVKAKVDFHISQGDLYRIPFFLKLFNTMNLRRDASVVTDAHIVLYFSDDEIQVEKMSLTGSAVPILGTGKLAYDGTLDLEFLTGKSKTVIEDTMSSVPLVGDILDVLGSLTLGAARSFLGSLIHVRATGTFREPVVKLEPFSAVTPSLTNFLRMWSEEFKTNSEQEEGGR